MPAAWIGVARIETGGHWPSDVAAGAFFGLLTANLVYNAHYGAKHGHAGIFDSSGPEVTLGLWFEEDGVAFGLRVRF